MSHPRLSDYFEQNRDKFEKRRKLLVLTELVYKPSGEKVIEGFRYFRCDVGALLDAFSRSDFEAISKLPFALDEDGDPDTSAVLLDLAYTDSGAMVAAQPVEYQDYNPTPVAAVVLLEGPAAKQLFPLIRQLDQSS